MASWDCGFRFFGVEFPEPVAHEVSQLNYRLLCLGAAGLDFEGGALPGVEGC